MIKQTFILVVYNKDVTCIIDSGKEPVCTTSPRARRRHNVNELPSHDPYIPRNNTILFNCSVECNMVSYNSMTEVVSPIRNIKSCFLIEDDYKCETIRYHNLKNVDKVAFLSQIIRNKTFYIVDCLVYEGGERICHKKDNVNSYANLVDIGTLARPKERNILAQDEFICEESTNSEINCDLNSFIPFDNGLKPKETVRFGDTVLLKSGSLLVVLSRRCIGSWCGYGGKISQNRKMFDYKVPGDMVFRCFYANKQQVCKPWYLKSQKNVYNDRGWISS